MSEDRAAGTAVIELRDVRLSLGDYEALRGVSVSFPAGESTVIMGPSGSGKSTLLKVAAGIIPPDTGRVFFKGHDIFTLSERGTRDMRKTSGFVFQDGALWENKTLFENLALPLQVHHPEMSARDVTHRIMRSLERLGMEQSARQRPAEMSGGEKKVASFLRALVTEPTLVFMDEPTLSIDFHLTEKISQMIRDLKARGATIIAVTHDPQLTSTLADRLAVIDAGQLLAVGRFDEVRKSRIPRVRSIISQVLGEIASYDTDLLALLDTERDGDEN